MSDLLIDGFFYEHSSMQNLMLFYFIVGIISVIISLILVFIIKDHKLKDRMILLIFYILVDLVSLVFGLFLTISYTIYLIRHKPKKYIHNISFII